MSRKNNNKALAKPSSYIDIILGSEVRQIAVAASAMSHRYGIDPELLVKRLFFDWQSKISCKLDGMLELDIEAFFGPEEFLQAKVPNNKEALKKAEEKGDLWPMPESWHRNPGAILDNMGAGGDQRVGLILALVNRRIIKRKLRKIIQKAIDHARHDKLILKGMDEGWIPVRVVIKLQFSTVGATGSGSMHWFLSEDGIRSCAKDDGVEANVVLQVICRGNLQTNNNEYAELNEYIAMKHIQVLGTGAYKSPITGKIQPVPFDSFFICCNQNGNGNMTEFEHFLAHQGHCDHFLFHTPAGAKMRERLPDMLAFKQDEYGEPQIAHTISCAFISRDSNRIHKFLSHKAAAVLARRITAEGNSQKAREYAAGLARQNGMIESDQDNQITKTVMHPAEFGNEDIAEIATAGFTDRIGNCRGLERAIAADNSARAILNSDIPQTYQSSMQKQTQAHLKTVINILEKNLKQMMRTFHGIWEAQRCYGFLKLIAERSLQSLMGKARELEEFKQPHEQILADASDRQNTLAQSRWWVRFGNSLLIRRLASDLEQSGLAVINYQLQIAACDIGVNDLLIPLLDYLDRTFNWLCGMSQKFSQAAQIFDNKADGIAAEPTTSNVPLGIELTTPEYLNDYFRDYVSRQGGIEKFSAYLLSRFLSKHGSLAFLAEASMEECTEVFTEICNDILRLEIETTNVISEFKRLYPDKNKQRRIIEQLIKQSEGRLLITGEVNESVVWLKAANVTSAEDAEWLREILESVDKKQGKWQVVVDKDADRISIAQLRGEIALQPLLDRLLTRDDPETWAMLVDRAPDPVSVLIVRPNPSIRQFRRELVKAIVNKQITVDENGCYILSCSTGEILNLGKTFETVHARLQPKWPELVFIGSTFGCNLVVSQEQIISELNRLETEIDLNTSDSDPLLGLIDITAVKESQTQAELLLPRLKRIRKANQRKLSQWKAVNG